MPSPVSGACRGRQASTATACAPRPPDAIGSPSPPPSRSDRRIACCAYARHCARRCRGRPSSRPRTRGTSSPRIGRPSVSSAPTTAAAFIPFSAPSIGAPEIDAVVAVLQSGWLTTGPRVREFEAAMTAYTGARFAVALNSCTAALHLSLLAAGVGPGDEVITTPLTFCATANAIIHTGATPVLADIGRDTMNLDPAAAEAA